MAGAIAEFTGDDPGVQGFDQRAIRDRQGLMILRAAKEVEEFCGDHTQRVCTCFNAVA